MGGYLSRWYAPPPSDLRDWDEKSEDDIHVSMGNAASNKTVLSFVRIPTMHYKCRGELYPRGKNIYRFPVPEEKVPWTVPFQDYAPVSFTSDSVASQPVWADLDYKVENSSNVRWNALDSKVDRRSHMGPYEIINKVPRNPVGRTGICDRGTLGRWGPNHAADPIVTRWKRSPDGSRILDKATNLPILQFIAILRRDSGEWAIPGGMVDAGENVSVTLKREFSEEALNALEMSPEDRKSVEKNISDLFHSGHEVYRGYVDDPRNTDNSWMETVAVNFHDDTGDSVGRIELNAGDDAVGVQWTDMGGSVKLFANHSEFIHLVAKHHKAHW